MKIRMLESRFGSADGIRLARYEAGEEYDLSLTERARDLAAVFVREGWAVEAKPAPVVEEKALQPARENKAIVAEYAVHPKGRRKV